MRTPPPKHVMRVRDLRERYGDAEQRAATCSCGWSGPIRGGEGAERAASKDGREHAAQGLGRATSRR